MVARENNSNQSGPRATLYDITAMAAASAAPVHHPIRITTIGANANVYLFRDTHATEPYVFLRIKWCKIVSIYRTAWLSYRFQVPS
jgi:hypothetical protein